MALARRAFRCNPPRRGICGTHRLDGERLWAARYRGGSLGPAVLL
jgi:hypothetical protein